MGPGGALAPPVSTLKDALCTADGNGPCESLLPKQHSEEIDPFECDNSEEDMVQEDVSHLTIDDDDDDDIIDVET